MTCLVEAADNEMVNVIEDVPESPSFREALPTVIAGVVPPLDPHRNTWMRSLYVSAT